MTTTRTFTRQVIRLSTPYFFQFGLSFRGIWTLLLTLSLFVISYFVLEFVNTNDVPYSFVINVVTIFLLNIGIDQIIKYQKRTNNPFRGLNYFLLILILNFATVYMLKVLNTWNNAFYNALQDLNEPEFWIQIFRFCEIVTIYLILAVYKFWFTQLLHLDWRVWMNEKLTNRWLKKNRFYKLELIKGQSADNPDQRIQEDVDQFTGTTVGLVMGFINAVSIFFTFVFVLWQLSGSYTFSWGDYLITIHGYMVFMALAYNIVGTLITFYLGRPQIKLNFLQQKKEANFRYSLMRIREYSEQIALLDGANREEQIVGNKFRIAIDNFFRLILWRKRFTWFSVAFGQASVIFPFLVSAPRFFSGAIKLGELMQISSAFGRLSDSLSWFVDSYTSLAVWKATTDRLTSFINNLDELDEEKGAELSNDSVTTNWSGLDLIAPASYGTDGQKSLQTTILKSSQSGTINQGEHTLLKGPSGTGKSVFFRTFAGIWPFSRGKVDVPESSFFLPQKPYFPTGTLKSAMAYPLDTSLFEDEKFRYVLQEVGLNKLVEMLEEDADWMNRLSGGELQRLSVARVLLREPAWIFADEITSAMETSAEEELYKKLLTLTESKGGALISTGHRPSLEQFHKRIIDLKDT